MIKDCVKRNNKKKWSVDIIDPNWYKCLWSQQRVREKNNLTKAKDVVGYKKTKNKINKLTKNS